jgi:hypothetical protein
MDVEICETDHGTYSIKDVEYLRVSRVITNYAGPYFAGPVSETVDVRQTTAMAEGTKMHEAIATFFTDCTMRRDFEWAGNRVCGSFGTFLETVSDTWELHSFERVVWSDRWRVAGRYDALFEDKSAQQYVLVDWKRSLCLYPRSYERYRMQLNLYRRLLKEQCNIDVSRLVIVQLHPDLDGPLMTDVEILSDDVVDAILENSYGLV